MVATQGAEVQDYKAMGEALGDAAAVLRANAGSAGLAANVPTCPGWGVGDLVAHVGMVHRWAAGYLTRAGRRSEAEVLAEAHAAPDLLDWFDEGLVDLLNAFASLPPDYDGKFFLPDAPPPRDAWLRRQVHETSVHAADAMAARLGRPPRGEELWMQPGLAADGVDEVLTGFAVQPSGTPVLDPGRRALLSAADVGRHWLVEGTDDEVRATRLDDSRARQARGEVDVAVEAPARELFLAVWNRGDTPGDPAFWGDWAQRLRVAWA